MKKGMLIAGIVCLMLAILGYVFRGALFGTVMAWQIGPDHDFCGSTTPGSSGLPRRYQLGGSA